ncbi:hypothetical protein [Anaerobutyricum hallii]|uniref:hypothetical protein n=1 Tax=Anaerobutyricum hallii TaxID=39488 RepID=UPI00399D114F
MAKLTPLSEKSVVGLLEGLSRRSTKKFTPFYDFVLRNFDHRNFGLLFPKFLLYWAKWSV